MELRFFVAGFLCAGFFVAALFFLRFWTRTRDRFFAAFAIAFGLMGLNQIAAAYALTSEGEDARAYLLRLAAFVLIILAILDKNLAGPRP
jgi:hypothetical protein